MKNFIWGNFNMYYFIVYLIVGFLTVLIWNIVKFDGDPVGFKFLKKRPGQKLIGVMVFNTFYNIFFLLFFLFCSAVAILIFPILWIVFLCLFLAKKGYVCAVFGHTEGDLNINDFLGKCLPSGKCCICGKPKRDW
jgi:hypothetical protein